jgi:hypothetical protein
MPEENGAIGRIGNAEKRFREDEESAFPHPPRIGTVNKSKRAGRSLEPSASDDI